MQAHTLLVYSASPPQARVRRDFGTADSIRQELSGLGVNRLTPIPTPHLPLFFASLTAGLVDAPWLLCLAIWLMARLVHLA